MHPHITKNGIKIEATLPLAKRIGKVVANYYGLEMARRALAAEGSGFSDMFIYRGGSHIAIHQNHGSPRLALITL